MGCIHIQWKTDARILPRLNYFNYEINCPALFLPHRWAQANSRVPTGHRIARRVHTIFPLSPVHDSIRWPHQLRTYVAARRQPLQSKQCVMANLIGRKQQKQRKRHSDALSVAAFGRDDFHIASLHASLVALALNTLSNRTGLSAMCPRASHLVVRPFEFFLSLCSQRICLEIWFLLQESRNVFIGLVILHVKPAYDVVTFMGQQCRSDAHDDDDADDPSLASAIGLKTWTTAHNQFWASIYGIALEAGSRICAAAIGISKQRALRPNWQFIVSCSIDVYIVQNERIYWQKALEKRAVFVCLQPFSIHHLLLHWRRISEKRHIFLFIITSM